MSGEGIHYALTREDAKRLFSARSEEALASFLASLEASHEQLGDRVAPCGVYWDVIHCVLSDGKLDPGAGEFPLNHCILGGRSMGQGDRIISMVRPDASVHVASAMEEIEEPWFRRRYFDLDQNVIGRKPCEEEFQAAWSILGRLAKFFRRAGENGHAVLFVAPKATDS